MQKRANSAWLNLKVVFEILVFALATFGLLNVRSAVVVDISGSKTKRQAVWDTAIAVCPCNTVKFGRQG
jgi:hypothetical protein